MENFKIDKVEVLANGDIQVRAKQVVTLIDGSELALDKNHRFVIPADDKKLYNQYKKELEQFGVTRKGE